MTKSEVETILGPPTIPNVIWEKQRRLVDLWNSDEKGIAIGYDPDGRVNFTDRVRHNRISSTIRRIKKALGLI